MAASAAAGNRVGAQTDGDPRPGQRIRIAGGASGGVTSSITSWSLLVMGPEARTTLGMEVSLSEVRSRARLVFAHRPGRLGMRQGDGDPRRR